MRLLIQSVPRLVVNDSSSPPDADAALVEFAKAVLSEGVEVTAKLLRQQGQAAM